MYLFAPKMPEIDLSLMDETVNLLPSLLQTPVHLKQQKFGNIYKIMNVTYILNK
jgi:hypothetical protein